MRGNLRAKVIIGVIALISVTFISRLFYLQVIDQEFKEAALETKARDRSVHAYRGIIYDRNGNPLVTNETIYDLMITTGDVHDLDTNRFCVLLGISRAEFNHCSSEVREAGKKKLQSSKKPYPFIKQISLEQYASIQDRFDFSGFSFSPRLIRNYPQGTLASTLGYIAEIDPDELKKDESGYYRPGDYVGKSGLEKVYERFLKGIRGKELFLVNRNEIDMGPYEGGIYDSIAIPGCNLITSIDAELQAYGERLMLNKSGSIVAIEPSTGEILSIVTAPSYDPNMLTGKKFSDNFYKLKEDTARDPLYNRATMGTYPPGSIFKLVQAAIALEEGIVKDGESYRIGPYPNMGDHSPAGSYTIQKAIMKSSNWFFAWKYKEMIHLKKKKNRYEDAEYGFDNWRDHLLKFGLGEVLHTDLGFEKSGNVPTNAYYDKEYGDRRWKASTIISNAIGQGELLVVPVQMANFAACIANRGYWYTPHVVKKIEGDTTDALARFRKKHYTRVDSAHFEPVIDGMEMVINTPGGTGYWRARIDSIIVCGKTGTAENPHGEDHSVFIAFAPKDNPKIAVAVYVENAGYGGTWAAPITSLMIEKYLTRETNQRREKRILEKNFFIVEEEE